MSAATNESLARLLDRLEAGEKLNDATIAALSDLGRDAAALVHGRWAAIPAPVRQGLLAQAASLALRDVMLDFHVLALAALDDPEPAVRRLAIGALWESDHRETGRGLLRVLGGDHDASVRGAAASGLRRFVLLRELGGFDQALGDEIVAGLRRVAESESEPPGVRARAIESLGCRSLPWVGELIRDSYYADETELRLAAVVAMGESADEQWLDYLFEQLQSDDPRFRASAALACGVIGAEDAVEELAARLDDEDMTVAGEALHALGEIGGEAAIAYLRAYEDRVPESLRERLGEALAFASSDGLGDL